MECSGNSLEAGGQSAGNEAKGSERQPDHSLIYYGKDWLNSEGEGICSENFEQGMLGSDAEVKVPLCRVENSV